MPYILLFACKWKCKYDPNNYLGIVKNITIDLLPKPRKKMIISNLEATLKQKTLKKNISARQGSAKRKARRKPKPSELFDSNAPPKEDEELNVVPTKSILKRALQKKTQTSAKEC